MKMENLGNIPVADRVFHGSDSEKPLDISIDIETVRRKLDKLRPDKASGSDDLSPRMLMELKEEICYPVMGLSTDGTVLIKKLLTPVL